MKKQIENILNNEATTKSQKMIELYNLDLQIKEIATLMNVRYNFVYNVIQNYTIQNDLQIRTKQSTNSKKSKIIELYNEGKSNIEIAKELKCYYNYVYKITKELINK